MMKCGFAGFAAAIAIGAFATPGAAATITDDFAFTNSGGTLASGSFSYNSSAIGDIGYADLSAFSITVLGQTYDLDFISHIADNFVYFGFDPAANLFKSASVSGHNDPLPHDYFLSATTDAFDLGFVVASGAGPNNIAAYDPLTQGTWTRYSITQVSATTPIPATLPLFLSAIGGLGFAGWRRRG